MQFKIKIGKEYKKERAEHPTFSDEQVLQIVKDHRAAKAGKGKGRERALYRGLPESNARKLQRKLKSHGVKTHAVRNPYGTYDVYGAE